MAGALALAFCLSVFFSGPGANLGTLALVATLLLFAMALWLRPLWRARTFDWSRIHWAVVVYLAWLAVNVWLSTLPENSFYAFWVLGSFGVAFFVVNSLPKRDYDIWFINIVAIGLFSALWGLVEFFITLERANGPIIDPNSWASLNNALFFAVLASRPAEGRTRLMYYPALFVFALAVAASYSRVGGFIFGAGILYLVAASWRHLPLRRQTLTALLIGVAAFSIVEVQTETDQVGLNDRTAVGLEERGWKVRLSMWEAGIKLFKEYPLTGSGNGTFGAHYARLRQPADMGTTGSFVHNDYIQAFAEGGIVLGSLLLGLVIVLLRQLAISTHLLTVGKDEGAFGITGLTVAMGTVLVHALMNFALHHLSSMILMGAFLAVLVRHSGAIVERPPLPIRPLLMKIVFGLAGSLGLFTLYADVATNYLVFGKRPDAYSNAPVGFFDDQQNYFETIQLLGRVRPGNATNHFALATLYRMSLDSMSNPDHRQSLATAAAVEYLRGLELNPYQYKVRGYLADLLEQIPNLRHELDITETPSQMRATAARMAPVYAGAHMTVAGHLPQSDAYEYLVAHALPWANLRYDGFKVQRFQLLKQILPEAIRRGDRAVLTTILEAFELGETQQDVITSRRARQSRLCRETWRRFAGCSAQPP